MIRWGFGLFALLATPFSHAAPPEEPATVEAAELMRVEEDPSDLRRRIIDALWAAPFNTSRFARPELLTEQVRIEIDLRGDADAVPVAAAAISFGPLRDCANRPCDDSWSAIYVRAPGDSAARRTEPSARGQALVARLQSTPTDQLVLSASDLGDTIERYALSPETCPTARLSPAGATEVRWLPAALGDRVLQTAAPKPVDLWADTIQVRLSTFRTHVEALGPADDGTAMAWGYSLLQQLETCTARSDVTPDAN